jgi:hypothetical protein
MVSFREMVVAFAGGGALNFASFGKPCVFVSLRRYIKMDEKVAAASQPIHYP